MWFNYGQWIGRWARKSGSNIRDAGIGLLKRVQVHWHIGLWEWLWLLDVVLPIAWERLGVKRIKKLVGLREKMYEWMTCLPRVLLLMWMGLFDMFHQFHFLKVTKEVESLIVASLVTCLPWLASFLGGPRRKGCYKLVSERGCALLGWRWLVIHACHVCLLHLQSICLLHCIMLIMVVVRFSWGTWCWFCGMHRQEYMTSYMIICSLITSSYVKFHS